MKYLTVFQLGDFESAASFNSKKDATAFIEECAKAAKTKALENREDGSYLMEIKSENGIKELHAAIKPVDTTVKYELAYEKNGQHIETTYYATRKAAVDQAKKTLDELGYDASTEENNAGKWSINNPEQNLTVSLVAKLVVMGSEGENIVASYDATEMADFCKHIDASMAQLSAAQAVENADLLKAGRKKGLVNLGIGLAIAAVGGLISLASYHNAKPGETYTVYTGIIVVGIIDAICGLYYLINPKATLPKDKKK